MTAAQINEFMEQTLFALARTAGAGVDFMEPIVLMAKLRVHKTPEKDDAYYWQQTLLLRVRREKTAEGTVWTFFGADGSIIASRFQEKRKNHKENLHGHR